MYMQIEAPQMGSGIHRWEGRKEHDATTPQGPRIVSGAKAQKSSIPLQSPSGVRNGAAKGTWALGHLVSPCRSIGAVFVYIVKL